MNLLTLILHRVIENVSQISDFMVCFHLREFICPSSSLHRMMDAPGVLEIILLVKISPELCDTQSSLLL